MFNTNLSISVYIVMYSGFDSTMYIVCVQVGIQLNGSYEYYPHYDYLPIVYTLLC